MNNVQKIVVGVLVFVGIAVLVSGTSLQQLFYSTIGTINAIASTIFYILASIWVVRELNKPK